MTGILTWVAAVIAIALVGRLGWSGLRVALDEPLETPSGWVAIGLDSLWGFLSGLSLLSACLLVLVHLGVLTPRALGIAVASLVVSSALVCRRRGVLGTAIRGMPRAAAAGAILAVLSLALGALLPPFDTTIAASDSSIYLGAAHRLAREGTLVHHDRVAGTLTPEERAILFANRFAGDGGGRYIRFPGGVPLLSPSRDDVTFSFSHLFPAWLAVALRTLGDTSYLRILGFFACVSLLSLFLLGRMLGGPGTGLAACLLLFSFYPQVFYTRFPMSEVLAQALFVSGLLALFRGLEDGGRSHLVLAGTLWGAFCLSRVDALPLLLLGLFPMSLLATRLGLRTRDWAIPAAVTLLFGALAVEHQASNGPYLGPLRETPLAVAFRVALAERPVLRVAGLLAIGGLGLAVLFWSHRPRSRDRLVAALKVLSGVSAAVVAVFFLSRVSASAIATHAGWIALYTGRVLPLVLGAGLVAAAVRASRGREPRAVGVALLFFLGPAACYLVDPLVVAQQPWAMRRFLPMIAPLFVLLSLHGWRSGLRRLAGRRVALAGVAFVGLAALSAGGLLRPSLGLLLRPGSVAAAPEIAALAQKVPPGALIVVPDSLAGLHLQIPLQFMCGRDVVLLPLAADDTSPALEAVAARFLGRELEAGRPVVLLRAGPSTAGTRLLRRFHPTLLFEVPLSWTQLPFAPAHVFPPLPHTVLLQIGVWELQPTRRATSGPPR